MVRPRLAGNIPLTISNENNFFFLIFFQRNGADFSVFVNTAHEFDGSDSGARPDEAVSWGKIKVEATPVKVFFSDHGRPNVKPSDSLNPIMSTKKTRSAVNFLLFRSAPTPHWYSHCWSPKRSRAFHGTVSQRLLSLRKRSPTDRKIVRLIFWTMKVAFFGEIFFLPSLKPDFFPARIGQNWIFFFFWKFYSIQEWRLSFFRSMLFTGIVV